MQQPDFLHGFSTSLRLSGQMPGQKSGQNIRFLLRVIYKRKLCTHRNDRPPCTGAQIQTAGLQPSVCRRQYAGVSIQAGLYNGQIVNSGGPAYHITVLHFLKVLAKARKNML